MRQMPSLIDRTQSVARRGRHFLPVLLCLAAAAVWTHPAALVPLLLVQPLWLAGLVAGAGYLLEPRFQTLLLRRGVVFFALWVVYALLISALVGLPMAAIANRPAPPLVLWLSAGVVSGLLLLWRHWPSLALVFVWDDAYPDAAQRSWILSAAHRALVFAQHLTRGRDFFGSGLWVSGGLLGAVVGALLVAGLLGPLQPEVRLVVLGIWGLVWSPLSAWLLLRCCERLLFHAQPQMTTTTEPAVAPERLAQGSDHQVLSALGPVELSQRILQAAAAHQVDLALALLAAGASADARPDPHAADQRSLLVRAATCADLRLLRALIARKADLNAASSGLTPLLAAVRDSYAGRPDAVLTLVTNGADPRLADPDGNTPLHHAARSREPSVCAILIDAGADPNVANRDGMTPLAVACAAGNEWVVRYLLEHGAKPDWPKATPALVAACGGTEDLPQLVKSLLRHKAAPRAQDALGRTALHVAALQGHAEMADALIAAGIDVDHRDAHGVTALMEAARAGSNRVLQRLVFRRPHTEFTDRSGRTALIIACQSRQANEETVRLLLAMGARPDARSIEGRTAVDFAAVGGRWDLVSLIDPQHKLPSALSAAVEEVGEAEADPEHADPDVPQDRCQLLAQALKHGKFWVADELLAMQPAWTQDELAAVFARLAGQAARDRLEWLLWHGLSPDAPAANGEPLLFALLRARPLSLMAIEVLVRAGAAVGGGSLLVELLCDAAEVGGAEAPLREPLACELVERGANGFARDEQQRGLLHWAVLRKAGHLLQVLLERGLDPNAADRRGRTALHELSALPDVEAVPMAKILLYHGANPERSAVDGQTPIGAALACGRAGLIRWLSWNTGFRHPGRPLRHADLPRAAQAGDVAAVDRLIVLGLPIDAVDAQGCTALLRACGGGYPALTALLLKRGANPALSAHSGAHCLSAAISARHETVVGILLENHVPPDQPLPGGVTPLMVAAALGLNGVVHKLLAAGARVGARDAQGNTALHAAAQFAFGHALEGAEPLAALCDLQTLDAANAAGHTPLLLLLGAQVQPGSARPQRNLPDALRALLTRGADVRIQDQRGVSPLHAAAMHGLLDCCLPLLQAGADPNARDRLNRTPHELALMLGYVDVAAQLKAPLRAS